MSTVVLFLWQQVRVHLPFMRVDESRFFLKTADSPDE